MGESIFTGLTILIVGMITVFAILSLVVISGKGLIFFVNKLYPAPVKIGKISRNENSRSGPIDKAHVVAIAAIVELLTKGKGRTTGIQQSKKNGP